MSTATRCSAGSCTQSELVESLRAFPEVRSIHWAVNDSPAEVTNLPSDLLWGEEAIEEQILDLRFRVRPNAFLQTNTEMCEVLYSLAAELAELIVPMLSRWETTTLWRPRRPLARL